MTSDDSPTAAASAQPRHNNRRRRNGNQGGNDARQQQPHGRNGRPDERGGSAPYKKNYFPKGKKRPSHTRQVSGEAQQQERHDYYVRVGEPAELTGLLDFQTKDGKAYAFMRVQEKNWAFSKENVYVPPALIEEYHLRPFAKVRGMAQKYERGHQLISVLEVNDMPPEKAAACPHFDDLKAVNPTERISFETEPSRYTTRTLDLVAPVARGQRGLIVAPPRTGKTTLLMHIAEAVMEKYKGDLHLMVLLVDERPEEVTEFRRALPGVEIFASSNDSGITEHCKMAEMCITYAKRLVETGKHVLVLMDSITRLARAYNNARKGSGRTMSGGIDARALEIPRMLFAAARNTRQAGSLTILATALIETNSRMDELIFQEFKGTGNMELVLNRRIAELYIYPAVDILKSGTRREELILPPWMLEKLHLIRRALAGHKPPEAMERLLFFMRKCSSNAQMLMNLKTR